LTVDLGLQGKKAIVCASSQGLGRACAEALAEEGVDLVINGRDAQKLEATAAEIRSKFGVTVNAVTADINTPEGRARLLEACPEPDILVTNNAGPKPGSIEEISEDEIAAALQSHYWTPLLLLRSVLPGMKERRFGRIINITSAMVASPRWVMSASTGARTGMTAVMKATSQAVAPYNVLINQILPERIDSGRQVEVAHFEAERDGISFAEAHARQAETIAVKRHGRPEEVGAACAFLAAARFGFINGVSLRLDGGSYNGLL
jgi:3-oxoacyl-[acyl-carrier protein] reductase